MKALERYQVILLGEQRHIRCEQLAQGCSPNNATAGVEPATSQSQVRHPTTTLPSHMVFCYYYHFTTLSQQERKSGVIQITESNLEIYPNDYVCSSKFSFACNYIHSNSSFVLISLVFLPNILHGKQQDLIIRQHT